MQEVILSWPGFATGYHITVLFDQIASVYIDIKLWIRVQNHMCIQVFIKRR